MVCRPDEIAVQDSIPFYAMTNPKGPALQAGPFGFAHMDFIFCYGTLLLMISTLIIKSRRLLKQSFTEQAMQAGRTFCGRLRTGTAQIFLEQTRKHRQASPA